MGISPAMFPQPSQIQNRFGFVQTRPLAFILAVDRCLGNAIRAIAEKFRL
jgi:hypothetical protein